MEKKKSRASNATKVVWFVVREKMGEK